MIVNIEIPEESTYQLLKLMSVQQGCSIQNQCINIDILNCSQQQKYNRQYVSNIEYSI